ncbi:Mu transposase C-terminal domain-containing protein [Laribacter hongkongensis]|uniref:Mu transposase C-terminal domain-containing protein n=1 Tax=Laribacter hongkongensis TaxID=168471 RepID=UPI001EFC97F2|nr:Mu transposase C-terminal domain-containing protein [Laribacter hongkongensis]MCG9053511.1 Mu transposase C-terminal domain-containing protein [Laribacter hongkongensis]
MNTPSTLLQLQPGTAVVYQNRLHRITHVLDLDEVLLVDEETNQVSHAKVGALEAVVGGTQSVARPDLVQVLDKDWEEAKRRYEIIRPLLDKADRSRQDVTERGKACGLHTNTLYEWIRRYEDSHLLTSLLPRIRNDKGSTKLTQEVETIIQAVVESEYLTKQRKSQQKVCDEVRKRCLYAGIEPPHDNTVRNRLKLLAGEHVMAKRRGRKAADQAYSPIEGSFPGADWPLAVVQIDHTPLDIILVDDIDRRPVNKPWITLAIDVFSRMVVGFYVSFDPPGALSAGQCLASAILPKESWLAKHDIKGEWPCWGMPAKLHMDNAREFRGNMLKRACDQYGIDIEWRPVARPHFGGHIERLLGTFAKEIHTLPGTTFSNVQERGDYDSEGKAALTLTELEEWLVTFIVNVYHQRVHSSLNMPPMEKYRQGIFGTKDSPGRGLPARITDEDRLRLDLMPYEERTVQDYGVVIDEIHYYHDVLRRWINAPDPVAPKYKRKFMFRRDPRDISTIWFYDPEIDLYYPIPYRDTSHPPISIWEMREAKRRAEADGRRHVDERALFAAYDRMCEIEQNAQAKTTSVRRAAQRRKHHQEVVRPLPQPVETAAEPVPPQPQTTPAILPFDEMDDLA